MKTLITIALLSFVAATSCFGQELECNDHETPCAAYANADAVFIAKVTSIRPETIKIWQRDKDYDQVANVVVEKIYKGITRNRLVLYQLGSKNAPKFILNSKYLFYANFDRVTKKWEVRRCGRTRMAAYVQNDLRYIDGLPASARRTRIAGEITRYDTDEENPAGTTQRLADTKSFAQEVTRHCVCLLCDLGGSPRLCGKYNGANHLTQRHRDTQSSQRRYSRHKKYSLQTFCAKPIPRLKSPVRAKNMRLQRIRTESMSSTVLLPGSMSFNR